MRTDTVNITQYIAIPEPHNMPAAMVEINSSGLITGRRFPVMAPIHFDNQPEFRTGEVHNIRANRKLTPKAKPHQSVRPKFVPQLQFRFRHGSSHATRTDTKRGSHIMMWHVPPSVGFADISPSRGEIGYSGTAP